MKIEIVKNNQFETVGMHISTTAPGYYNAHTVFTWGIRASMHNFSKTVPGDYFEEEVFALVQAEANLRHAKDIFMTFVLAVEEAGVKVEKKEDGSFSLGNNDWYKNKEREAEDRVLRAIKKLEEAINKQYK